MLNDPDYEGGKMLYSKFSPSFKTAVGGTILDIDMPDEKYFAPQRQSGSAGDYSEDFQHEVTFSTPIYLQILSRSKNGNLFSAMVNFCPPGYFYDIRGSSTLVCYRKHKLEFGLGIHRDEDKMSRRFCDKLKPMNYTKESDYYSQDHLEHSGYFDRCFDVNFTKKYALSSEFLTIDSPNFNPTDINSGIVQYKNLKCKQNHPNCMWYDDPDYISCRSIKDCYKCSLSPKCVFKVENSTCVSAAELEDLEDYEFLKIWKNKYSTHLGISTLANLDLASLKIFNSCPKSKDLQNLLTTGSEKIILGARFDFPNI